MPTRATVYFDTPYQVTLHQEELPAPRAREALVQTIVSAVSAGTELLFYRGLVPPGMAADTAINGLSQTVAYPIAYGYAAVGRVIACGPNTPPDLMGQLVFSFQPHTSHFLAAYDALFQVPASLDPEPAALLPNMETAVNLVMDAQPMLGERVLVLGQGVVGLLTIALLAQYPLAQLVAVDDYAQRLALSQTLGATHTATPDELHQLAGLDPDLVLELSGNPAALAAAVELAGFGTRILVGSWYGQKPVNLPLGGSFHRNRIQIISSQVSTLDARHHNRWTKARRFDLAWQQLRHLETQPLITHRFPLHRAAEAYQLLDSHPDQTIQLLFTY